MPANASALTMVHFTPPDCLACAPAEFARAVAADAALTAAWESLPRRHFAAGTALLRIGEPASKVWLIQRGLVRFYFLSAEGTERNKSFHTEGAWIGGGMPPRIVPGSYAVEALEDVDVVELSFDALDDCMRRFPAVRPMLEEALSWVFARQSMREAELLTLDAATRYQRFLSDYAHLATRLPLHHVASHLGITNVALSRIRSRLGLTDARRR